MHPKPEDMRKFYDKAQLDQYDGSRRNDRGKSKGTRKDGKDAKSKGKGGEKGKDSKGKGKGKNQKGKSAKKGKGGLAIGSMLTLAMAFATILALIPVPVTVQTIQEPIFHQGFGMMAKETEFIEEI